MPIGTICTPLPLLANLLLFCYERDIVMSVCGDTQACVIEVFNSTSRYLDDLLNIDNPYCKGMGIQIYLTYAQSLLHTLFTVYSSHLVQRFG